MVESYRYNDEMKRKLEQAGKTRAGAFKTGELGEMLEIKNILFILI